MTFQRTRDYELVKQIATHEAVFYHLSDDFNMDPAKWEPIKNEQVWYVLAKDGEEVLGLFALIPDNRICWKAHPCLLPAAFGPKSREITKEFIGWLWANTPCLRLIAEVPEFNTIVKKYARECGMEEFGVNAASLLKGGELHNQILFGISKPKELTWA